MNALCRSLHLPTSLILARGFRTTTMSLNLSLPPSPDAVVLQKRHLRSRMRRLLRQDFPPHLRRAEDAAIQRHVLESSWYKSSSRLCAYVSCEALREVDTSRIVYDILQEEHLELAKKLYLPRVQDKASHMQMLRVVNLQHLQANSMDILEPTEVDENGIPLEDVMQATEPVDLVLVPGLAFDSAGHRLGRSGGYYDLFLKNYLSLTEERGWKCPLIVALAYSVQLLDDSVPVHIHDMPMDALVSASGVFPISELALEQM
eukprot:c24460_g1_i2 orf=89-868(+)